MVRLAGICNILSMICMYCGCELKLIAFVTEATPMRRILNDTGDFTTRQGIALGHGPAIKVAELDPSISASGPIPRQYLSSGLIRPPVNNLAKPRRSGGLGKHTPARFTGNPKSFSPNKPRKPLLLSCSWSRSAISRVDGQEDKTFCIFNALAKATTPVQTATG